MNRRGPFWQARKDCLASLVKQCNFRQPRHNTSTTFQQERAGCPPETHKHIRISQHHAGSSIPNKSPTIVPSWVFQGATATLSRPAAASAGRDFQSQHQASDSKHTKFSVCALCACVCQCMAGHWQGRPVNIGMYPTHSFAGLLGFIQSLLGLKGLS